MNVQMAKQIGLTIEQAIRAEEMACCMESIAGHFIKHVDNLETEIRNLKNSLSLIGRRITILDGSALNNCSGRIANVSPYSSSLLVDFGQDIGHKHITSDTRYALETC